MLLRQPAPDLPIIPVLRGESVADRRWCADTYKRHGVATWWRLSDSGPQPYAGAPDQGLVGLGPSRTVAYVTSAAVGVKGSIGALSLYPPAPLCAIMVPVAGVLAGRFARVRVYRGFALFQLVAAWVPSLTSNA